MVEHEITGWVDRFNWLLSRVTMWLVAIVIAVMAYEVIMRYAFVRPTIWANELSLWLAGMVYLFAGLYAMQQRSHIRIFILYDLAPRWLRKLFDLISTVCLVLFSLAVIWGGYGEAKAKLLRWETFGTAFDPPIPATMKPLVLITVSILAIQAISNLIHDWHNDPESHDPADELRDQVSELSAAMGVNSPVPDASNSSTSSGPESGEPTSSPPASPLKRD